MQMKSTSGIIQMRHIVIDIASAVDRWVDSFGAGPFFTQQNLNIPVEYRGTPSDLDMHVALGQCGPVQIELVQIAGEKSSVYRDMYPDGRTGFHHVAMFVDNLGKSIENYAADDSTLGAIGDFGGCGFAYVDTRPSVGFFTELYEDKPFMRGFCRNIATASQGWDGSRRLRPLDEVV
jgi:Glyoxalase/Bleomycin resistance protein/Dioxygenase superfamily